MTISFAWTTPAVVLREKCVTRRDWKGITIAQFQGCVKTGELVDAWDKNPRFGGKPFGKVRILEVTPKEDSRTIPESAWAEEGFHILTPLGAKIGKSTPRDVWMFWLHENEEDQTVVRFELAELNDYGRKLEADAIAALEASGGVKIPLHEAL
jgi:hypothetical protein